MISVEDALKKIFRILPKNGNEKISLLNACGRVLAKDVLAKNDQPPFSTSAMDGYVISDPTPRVGSSYNLVGEVSAGSTFSGVLGNGEAIRIFTGAPIPVGGKRVIIQENMVIKYNTVTINELNGNETFIRKIGSDFKSGQIFETPKVLTPFHLSLIASMNSSEVTVYKKPTVAIISTGDELVIPGEKRSASQIISSNSFGIYSRLVLAGANPRLLPIAKDTESSLKSILELAMGSDIIVTVGGASVGDYDLVKKVLKTAGMKTEFEKVAMRPGKPLFAGKLNKSAVVGLPGNPVSSLICTEIFLVPAINHFLNMSSNSREVINVKSAKTIPKNGPREHYMRANYDTLTKLVSVEDRQDSSLLSVLVNSNSLVVRKPNSPQIKKGQLVPTILLN
ncbi:MAG: molybdopterin molybdenumtransferase MoeA [Rhodobacteraceae bacterium]|nr:molybdopterin molybdenumtransferase MoeA [Paracoccaceae bacterium]